MIHASQLFKLDRLNQMIAEGFVNVQKHPKYNYRIYNYSNTAVFGGVWNDVTLQCRGLILDHDYNVVARPFPRFFNIEELSSSDTLLKQPFLCFTKADGSLGVLYPRPNDEGHAIATRGSFTSDQAIRGTDMWNKVYYDIENAYFEPAEGYTYLFEIVYPENRIVLDYGGRSELIFLCAIHNETGTSVFNFGDDHDWPGARVEQHTGFDNPKELKDLNLENEEGFVLYFPGQNKRVKVKFEDYIHLHRILTNTSNKTIWKALKDGTGLDKLLENTPDEFYRYVKNTITELQDQYMDILLKVKGDFESILKNHCPYQDKPWEFQVAWAKQNRKEFASLAMQKKYPGLLFAFLDGKNFQDKIWDLIKPRYEKPFWNTEEDA